MTGNSGIGDEWHGNRWTVAVWGVAAFLLLLPLVAMQFTGEVKWDGADFVIFGAMLITACGTFELTVRLSGSHAYRAATGVAVAAAFLLIWVNLAVGIIGTEDDPANLMFGAVLAVAATGAALARFRPLGMARAMTATALVQAAIAVVALIAGHAIVLLTGGFVALWLLSAWLFRQAARERTRLGSAA